jgi:two-component system, NarL family, response regulator NreC
LTFSIIIADDHGLLRAGLRALLNSEPDMQVIGEAADGDAALSLAEKLHPDVLLADISMPGASGIEIARVMPSISPGTRVLIISMHEDQGLVGEAMAVGAAGYLIKRAAGEELIDAVRTVARGDVYLSADLAKQSQEAASEPSASDTSPDLAATEMEMLRLMAHGHTYRQIASMLGLSADAAECIRAELSKKLGIDSRTGFVVYAQKHGLL